MIFITLVKFKRRPTKEDLAESEKMFAQQEKQGIRTVALYWTLGRFDAVRIYEAPDEKTAMKGLVKAPDLVSTETLVAIKREDVARFFE